VCRTCLLVKLLLASIVFASGACVAQQPATVIHDGGQTVPIAPFLAPLFADQKNLAASRNQAQQRGAPNPPASPITGMFPLKTSKLSPGRAAPSKVKMLIAMPIFVIGDDEQSRQWMSRNEKLLFDSNATGIVVQAATEAQFWALRKQYPSLRMVPANGDELFRAFGLSRYPFLIKTGGEVVQ
jgi:integrating conjugative element protein (TIGR03765 family)